jgi:hypothetical protein
VSTATLAGDAMLLTLLGGCAGRTGSAPFSASPAFTQQDDCERNGGMWHANLGICETSKGGLK